MKKLYFSLIVALSVFAMSISAFAAGSEVETAMQTALDTLKTDTMSLILIALPVGLAIFAAFFGIRKGIALLRGVAK